ncbi:MAG: hypothetical protein Q4D71_07340 [Oscillospiraceae bacterium]|nr:hypothetical protein [Oscillospiraceae bacterium]
MKHLSDDEIMILAEVTEEQLVYSAEQLSMMEHLKTCRSCYEKFCCALTLMEVTGDKGYPLLSEIYGTEPEKSLVPETGKKILAVVSFVNTRIHEGIGEIVEQVIHAGDLFTFRPSVAMATRGIATSKTKIYKIEDINDDKTFIAVNPDRNELLLQVNSKGFDHSNIKAFLKTDSGERTEIHLDVRGKIYKGMLRNLPEGRYEIIIESDR